MNNPLDVLHPSQELFFWKGVYFKVGLEALSLQCVYMCVRSAAGNNISLVSSSDFTANRESELFPARRHMKIGLEYNIVLTLWVSTYATDAVGELWNMSCSFKKYIFIYLFDLKPKLKYISHREQCGFWTPRVVLTGCHLNAEDEKNK